MLLILLDNDYFAYVFSSIRLLFVVVLVVEYLPKDPDPSDQQSTTRQMLFYTRFLKTQRWRMAAGLDR